MLEIAGKGVSGNIQIRNRDDLQKHVDYIHYNPLKHGLIGAVEDWPWSTYHRFVRYGSSDTVC